MPTNDDFWTGFLNTAYTKDEGKDFAGMYLTATEKEEAEDERLVKEAVEHRLSGRALNEGSFQSVQGLTDRARQAMAITLPVEPGTRVLFVANMGSVLAYEDPPEPNANGVVVQVKSASGMVTSHDGLVFAKWDDGKVRGTHAEHLRLASGRVRTTASGFESTMRVASLGDLSGFLRLAGSNDTLVHKATKDLWSVKKDGSDYVISRLFDDSGVPLKV